MDTRERTTAARSYKYCTSRLCEQTVRADFTSRLYECLPALVFANVSLVPQHLQLPEVGKVVFLLQHQQISVRMLIVFNVKVVEYLCSVSEGCTVYRTTRRTSSRTVRPMSNHVRKVK